MQMTIWPAPGLGEEVTDFFPDSLEPGLDRGGSSIIRVHFAERGSSSSSSESTLDDILRARPARFRRPVLRVLVGGKRDPWWIAFSARFAPQGARFRGGAYHWGGAPIRSETSPVLVRVRMTELARHRRKALAPAPGRRCARIGRRVCPVTREPPRLRPPMRSDLPGGGRAAGQRSRPRRPGGPAGPCSIGKCGSRIRLTSRSSLVTPGNA